MAYWGQALVLGPNINAAMDAGGRTEGLRARAEGRGAEGVGDAARTGLHRRARGALHRQAPRIGSRPTAPTPTRWRGSSRSFPDDLDAQTLYAEALMDLRPWNYWTRDGVAVSGDERSRRSTLEHVLARHKNHPGALHLWIHLWEPTDTPERAEAEADRLLPLMPGAGHIVHMPAHIYSASAVTPT